MSTEYGVRFAITGEVYHVGYLTRAEAEMAAFAIYLTTRQLAEVYELTTENSSK